MLPAISGNGSNKVCYSQLKDESIAKLASSQGKYEMEDNKQATQDGEGRGHVDNHCSQYQISEVVGKKDFGGGGN
jgi:hypothetical protein